MPMPTWLWRTYRDRRIEALEARLQDELSWQRLDVKVTLNGGHRDVTVQVGMQVLQLTVEQAKDVRLFVKQALDAVND